MGSIAKIKFQINEKKKPKMYTLQEAGLKLHEAGKYPIVPSRSTMTQWCRRNVFPGATREPRPRAPWLVPPKAIRAARIPKMGRPRGKNYVTRTRKRVK